MSKSSFVDKILVSTSSMLGETMKSDTSFKSSDTTVEESSTSNPHGEKLNLPPPLTSPIKDLTMKVGKSSMDMFGTLLNWKFYSKCKSQINLTKTRIKIIKTERNLLQKSLKWEVANLLKNGDHSVAYDMIHPLYDDQKKSSCYEIVEESCLLLLSHLLAISRHSECPEECKEAISTLMFAATIFHDLPQLHELGSLFADKYGNALKPYVNKEFVYNLKRDPPVKKIRLQMMQEIALEFGIEWDKKAVEQKLEKTPPVVQETKHICDPEDFYGVGEGGR